MEELLLQSTMFFYVTNEIRVRLRTSLLLWCYFGCVFIIFLSHILVAIFIPRLSSFKTLPNILLFIFLLFFPVNLDIFARESQSNMLDYLAMNSARFITIYSSRITANAILMVVPIILGFVSLFIVQAILTNPSSLLFFLVYLPLILLFFLCWFFIALLVLSVVELKFPDSFFRIILYFGGLFVIIGLLFLINMLSNGSLIIIGVCLGLQLFENVFLTVVEIIIVCVITILLLSSVITRRIDLVVGKILAVGQVPQNEKFPPRFSFYSLSEAIWFIKKSSWQKIVPYLGTVPYLFLFIMVSDRSRLMETFMAIFGFHFFFILLYVFLMVFPQITIEKEFNMEELLLSRITVYQYFFQKVTLLLKSIFFPFMIASIVITILSWPSFFASIPVFFFLVIRAFYFVSVIIFIWRLFPTKNLLQSTTLSIFGLEVLGFLIINFILPTNIVLLIYSPIISSLLISQLIADPDFVKYVSSITFSIWMNLSLTIALFFASIILIKSEVRFD